MASSIAVALAGVMLITPVSAYATGSSHEVKCHMDFSLHGWSLFYKTAGGKGTVTCSNGQSMPVKLSMTGGGLTAGKSTVNNGHAVFSGVYDIKDVLGSYATGGAQAGAVKSSQAAVLTKGTVSMALSGTGSGWDLGVAVGAFKISPSGGN
ncbi:MAG: hypothetical protein ACRES7_09210 [Gammaproteobacteria bacterium]